MYSTIYFKFKKLQTIKMKYYLYVILINYTYHF